MAFQILQGSESPVAPGYIELQEMNPDGTYKQPQIEVKGNYIGDVDGKIFNLVVMPGGIVQTAISMESPVIPPSIVAAFKAFSEMQESDLEPTSSNRDRYKQLNNRCFKVLDKYNRAENDEVVKEFYDSLMIRAAIRYYGKDVVCCAEELSVIFANKLKKEVVVDPKAIEADFPRAKEIANLYRKAFTDLNEIISGPHSTVLEMAPALATLVSKHKDFLEVYITIFNQAFKTISS